MIPLSSVGGSLGAAQLVAANNIAPNPQIASAILLSNALTGSSTSIEVVAMSAGEATIAGYAYETDPTYAGHGAYFRINQETGHQTGFTRILDPRNYRAVGSLVNEGGAYCIFTANIYTDADPSSGFVITRVYPGEDPLWEVRFLSSSADRPVLTHSSSLDANSTAFCGTIGTSIFVGRIQSSGTVDLLRTLEIEATEVVVHDSLDGLLIVAKRLSGALVFVVMDAFGEIFSQVETDPVAATTNSSLAAHVLYEINHVFVTYKTSADDVGFALINLPSMSIVWNRTLDIQDRAFTYTPTNIQWIRGSAILQTMFDAYDGNTGETVTLRLSVGISDGEVYNDALLQIRENVSVASQHMLSSTSSPGTSERDPFWYMFIRGTNDSAFISVVPTSIIVNPEAYYTFQLDFILDALATNTPVGVTTSAYTPNTAPFSGVYEMFPHSGMEGVLFLETHVLEYIDL